MENFRQLLDYIAQYVDFKEEEIVEFIQNIVVQKYTKNALLLEEGEICETLYFINKGLVRAVNTKSNGFVFTQFFSAESSIITEPISFMSKKPSLFSIECIESVEIIEIPKKTIDQLCKTIKGNKCAKLIAENYFNVFMTFTVQRQLLSLLEQFNSINTYFPNIQKRVSQRMIASYLGITPRHLERIKSNKEM